MTLPQEVKEHLTGVGAIVMNLQALESTLRLFLLHHYGQKLCWPKQGDAETCRNYLTAYLSLRDLIDDYHKRLSDKEKQYEIDVSVADIRDALAHGRLLVQGQNWPAQLWKFGSPKGGKVPVQFSGIVMTRDWMKEQWENIDRQNEKVAACAKVRGY